MATDVIYNGVTLHNVLTRQWDQEIVYDATGTDLLGQRLKLQFDGVLHAQRFPVNASEVYVSGGSNSNDPFGNLAAVRNALGEPRQRLQVRVDGKDVIDVIGPGGDVQSQNADIENGPKPSNISVTPVGATAFRVSFSIEAVIGNCSGRSGDGLIINNRWRVSEAMDSNFFTTRTITGKLRLSRGPQKPGDQFAGHYFKPVVIPPLESSFRRERVVFHAEEDGLTCSYEIVDKQVHQAAPWPATKIGATHSETVNNGTFFVSEMSVRLEGDPSCNKQLLVERALQVADARINFIAIVGKGTMVESLTITDHIGDLPIVELRMRVRRTDTAGTKSLLMGVRTHDLGRDLQLPSLGNNKDTAIEGTGYDSQRSRVPKPYGYKSGSGAFDNERRPAVIYLLQCYLQNPCSGPHHVGPRGTTPSKGSDDRKSNAREDSTSVHESPNSLPDDLDTYSVETQKNIYTMAKMSTTYRQNKMLLQMPRSSRKKSNGSEIKEHPVASIISLAEEQPKRILTIDFERVGAMPELPSSINYAVGASGEGKAAVSFLEFEILPPVRSPDGRDVVNRVRATYLYVLSSAPDLSGSRLTVGVNPVTSFEDYDGSVQLKFSNALAGNPQKSS